MNGPLLLRAVIRKGLLASAAVLALVTLIFLVAIGSLQRLVDDDWVLVDRMRNFGVFGFIQDSYFQPGGRLQSIVIWSLVFSFPDHRFIFGIANAIIFIGFVFFAVTLALGRWPKIQTHDPLVLLLTFAALWFGLPVIDETVFWTSCSITYLWSTFFALAFLLPYRFWIEHQQQVPNLKVSPRRRELLYDMIMFAVGIFTGLGHEFLFVTLVFILGGWLLLVHRFFKLSSVPSWLWYGAAGLLIGGAINVPAIYLRWDNQDVDMTLVNRGLKFSMYLVYVFVKGWKDYWPWIIGLTLLSLLVNENHVRTSLSDSRMVGFGFLQCRIYIFVWWLLAAIVSLLPMLAVPSHIGLPRASFFAITFMSIAFCSLCYGLRDPRRESFVSQSKFPLSYDNVSICLVSAIISMVAIDALNGVITGYHYYKQALIREELLSNARGKGIDVQVPLVPPIPGLLDLLPFRDRSLVKGGVNIEIIERHIYPYKKNYSVDTPHRYE